MPMDASTTVAFERGGATMLANVRGDACASASAGRVVARQDIELSLARFCTHNQQQRHEGRVKEECI